MVLDSQRKLDVEYDILNLWNFPDGLRHKMKVGTFSPKAPQGQELFLSDDMIQWAIGFTEVGWTSYHCFDLYVTKHFLWMQ